MKWFGRDPVAQKIKTAYTLLYNDRNAWVLFLLNENQHIIYQNVRYEMNYISITKKVGFGLFWAGLSSSECQKRIYTTLQLTKCSDFVSTQRKSTYYIPMGSVGCNLPFFRRLS